MKSTSSIKLNQFIFAHGTITDIIDLGDQRIFTGFNPNCIIFRYEKDNYTRRTNVSKEFICNNGQLLFTSNTYPFVFSDVFFVKVGAVSGDDKIFANEKYGNTDFVCSYTHKTGKTKRMIYNDPQNPYLLEHKEQLLKRKIRQFDETNWWQWGRNHYISKSPRIYVNGKTRDKNPFFVHSCTNYDGSVLAVFPKISNIDIEKLCEMLNEVNWQELGFVCDGRYLFSQKSLENAPLPQCFAPYITPTLFG